MTPGHSITPHDALHSTTMMVVVHTGHKIPQSLDVLHACRCRGTLTAAEICSLSHLRLLPVGCLWECSTPCRRYRCTDLAADRLLLDISQDTKHAWQQPCVAERNIAFVLTLYVAAGVSAAGLTLARLSMISSSLLW